jgi:hypothetical protein
VRSRRFHRRKSREVAELRAAVAALEEKIKALNARPEALVHGRAKYGNGHVQ